MGIDRFGFVVKETKKIDVSLFRVSVFWYFTVSVLRCLLAMSRPFMKLRVLAKESNSRAKIRAILKCSDSSDIEIVSRFSLVNTQTSSNTPQKQGTYKGGIAPRAQSPHHHPTPPFRFGDLKWVIRCLDFFSSHICQLLSECRKWRLREPQYRGVFMLPSYLSCPHVCCATDPSFWTSWIRPWVRYLYS